MKERADQTPIPPRPTLSSPWLFFALVFCWSWVFWILAAGSGASIQTTLGRMLMWLGLLGPMLGGLAFTYLTQGKENRHEYWSRIVDPKRIPAKWYLVIFLFVPVLMGIAALLDAAVEGNTAVVQIGKTVRAFLSAPLTIVPFALHVFLYGPLPEELGWRGYVLDQLQARWNALASSLILGAVWALWHLPIFFIKDAEPHYRHGAWSAWFWLFMVGVVAAAVIYTWIFNNTRRSTLAAILFHFITNLTYGLANVTAGTNLYSTVLWIMAAIAVVALWGARTLTRP